MSNAWTEAGLQAGGTTPERPRIGVIIPPGVPDGDFVGYVQEAERLGFHEVWVVEDCFLRGAFAQAATVLATTRSLAWDSASFPPPPGTWPLPPWR